MVKAKKGFEMRNRPDWLYNSLPYAYIAIGVVVMVSFGLPNIVGALSGVVFISTGAVVFTMRRLHRRELAKFKAELAVREQREASDELSLLRISWSKKYESGNPIIDEQHRQLFDLGNALLNTMLSDEHSNEIPIFLDSLLEHIQQHLFTEEKVLSDLKHPITIEHKTDHEHLLALAKGIVNKYRRGTLDFGDVSEFITFDLIAAHIVAEDKQYFVSHPEPATPVPTERR
jgi:hemerythrin-like metal-binding protein